MGRSRPGLLTEKGVTLDAGALIAVERGSRQLASLLGRARIRGTAAAVPAAVVAQVWRDGRRQSRLAQFLGSRHCEVVPLDAAAARIAGHLCAISGTSDVVDASVVVVARQRGHRVVTSDPDDLRRLDPRLELVIV
ncbi:MAG: PIN domain-containing protein [Frankiaceae bacterium]|nr:PIN domain-containing protein [Frankiaceae bacterium]